MPPKSKLDRNRYEPVVVVEGPRPRVTFMPPAQRIAKAQVEPEFPPHLRPRINVPDMGQAEVMLGSYLASERVDEALVGNRTRRIVRWTYFRLRLPNGRYWFYNPQAGANQVPQGARPCFC